MSMIKCPECGHPVSTSAPVCPECGVRIQGNIMKCPQCGEIIIAGQEQCPHCNFSLANVPHTMPGESQTPLQPKHKNRTWLWVVIACVVVAVAGGVGYYFYSTNSQAKEIERAYKMLDGVTDEQAYQDFLDKYPDSEYCADVTERLKQVKAENIDWNNIASSRFSADYETFRQNHPNSLHDRECTDRIDSLDWLQATQLNTPDAFDAYLLKHANGRYASEANIQKEQVAKLEVTPEDLNLVRSAFANYFSSLSEEDESGICSVLAPVLNSFLNKQNATKNDVLSYMHRIFSEDVLGMHFALNNDFKVTKTKLENGEYQYNVAFTVDQTVKKEDTENVTTYAISGSVTTDGKIGNLNMKQVG